MPNPEKSNALFQTVKYLIDILLFQEIIGNNSSNILAKNSRFLKKKKPQIVC